jgi:superoxide dismutase
VADRIAKDFGSFQVFKDAFTTQSLRLFGSG